MQPTWVLFISESLPSLRVFNSFSIITRVNLSSSNSVIRCVCARSETGAAQARARLGPSHATHLASPHSALLCAPPIATHARTIPHCTAQRERPECRPGSTGNRQIFVYHLFQFKVISLLFPSLFLSLHLDAAAISPILSSRSTACAT